MHKAAMVVLVLCSHAAWSDAVEVTDTAHGRIRLQHQLDVLDDPEHRWTIDDITNSDRAPPFAPIEGQAPLLRVRGGAMWVRLSLTSASAEPVERFLELARAELSTVDLFVADSDDQWQRRRTGTTLPFDTRDVSAPNYVFRLRLEPDARQTVFLRLVSERTGIIPVTLWVPEAFFEHERQRQVGLGIFYGGILSLILFNLAFYAGLRDRSYLYCVLYMATSLCGWAIDAGVGFEYLWPERAGWNSPILFVVIGLNELAFLKFTQSFLLTSQTVPRLHRVINWWMVALLLLLVSPPLIGLEWAHAVNELLSPALLLLWLGAGSLCWARGYSPARIYFLAGLVTISGIVAHILMRQGVLAMSPWLEYAGHLGWACTGLLISIGLALRMNVMRREREQEAVLAREQKVRAEHLVAEFERRAEEFETARQLQQGLLPAHLPDVDFLEIAAYQRSATEVGGDYYDFFLQDDESVCGVIGDATGHGISAGLMVACAKTALLAVGSENTDQTAESVNTLLRRLNLGGRMFMALMLYRAHRGAEDESVVVSLTGAGIPPAYAIRVDGSVEEILVPGQPLGVTDQHQGQSLSMTLSAGDRLVLMSDGLPERNNEDGEMLGYDRLQKLIVTIAETATSADETVQGLVAVGERWAGQRPLEDDETFIVLRAR